MKTEPKRRTTFLGLPINVEIEAGELKSGVDEAGQAWSHTYELPSGEIDGTHALSDGDPVDVYLGPIEREEAQVFVVHQLRKDGTPDEDKVMLGFHGAEAAQDAYEKHGPPWGFGSMDEMTLDQFKNGYLAANRVPAQEIYNSAAAREAAGKARYGT